MSNYVTRAQKFVRDLYPFILSYDEDGLFRAAYAFNSAKHRRVHVMSGAARVAFITSDYVVKIDYTDGRAEGCGGCLNEIKFYRFACREGYDYLLAAIDAYEYMGVTFYIMPKIAGVGCHEFGYGLTEDEIDWLMEFVDDLHQYNFGVRAGKLCVIDYAWSYA